MTLSIARLTESPVDALAALIVESETHGLRFVRRLVDEWSSGANRFDATAEALFVARLGDEVIGVCGLNIDPCTATARIGRVRHLYVLSAHRRAGVGRNLVAEVIKAARNRFEQLHLRTESPAAAHFYAALGFRRTVDLPHCTHVMALGGKMTISSVIPQLRTTDLAASIRFYTTQVGLTLDFQYEDFYAGIRAGSQLFHLKLVDAKDPSIDFVDKGEHFHLYLETDDAVTAAEALRRNGVRLVQEVHDTPWDTREFAIKDDQGHTLYFGERRRARDSARP